MDRKARIEQEVLATIGYFDREPSLPDNPAFLAGVERKIRMSTASTRSQTWTVFRRRVLVPAVLSVAIVLNVVTVFGVAHTVKSTVRARQDGLTALTEYYGRSRADYSAYLK